MNLNPAAVPAILLTIPLFWVGITLQAFKQPTQPAVGQVPPLF
jgi:hypothetical protein